MDLKDIQPFVRFSNTVVFHRANVWFKTYDYRLFYVLRGKGAITIENSEYELNYGSLVVHPPNAKYRFWWDNDEELSIISINFDLTQNHSYKNTLILQGRANNFNENDVVEVIKGTLFDNLVYLSNMQVLENDIIEIHRENAERKIYYDSRSSAIMKSILLKIARIAAMDANNTSKIT